MTFIGNNASEAASISSNFPAYSLLLQFSVPSYMLPEISGLLRSTKGVGKGEACKIHPPLLCVQWGEVEASFIHGEFGFGL